MSIRQGKIIIADSVSSTTDYQDLINKPKINGIELDGNKTAEDLNIRAGITSINGDTGTDGAVTVKAIENANPNNTMLKVWNGTTAEYLALAEKDLNTIYNVTDEVSADTSKINGFNLFDFKWSDHLINNISWTRADNFSWHSAAVYVSAYNKLLKEKERASTVLETETIDDITISFYRSENNYKICLPDQLANLTSLYEKTGVAWYYVIDTENKQFKLPRTKWGFTGLRNKAGDYVSESLPNITGGFKVWGANGNIDGTSGAFYNNDEGKTSSNKMSIVSGTMDTAGHGLFSASRSSSTYKDNAPVQERATEMYLYFYVGNTVTVESEVNLDTLVTDVENLKKGSGGSLEIGDIGFSAFGIDETKNLRRYLNGQVISQIQFTAFTTKIKAAIALYPNLATTETNWQAEVTNSKLGQCGKFVIDDTAGTIRLPKVVNINGLTDLSLMGGIKAESLPNIKSNNTNHFIAYHIDTSGYDGALKDEFTERGVVKAGSDTGTGHILSIDASRSSSTYQDNAPVQQEAVQYPYFIQVATGVEESVDVSTEIQLNNPFSLLDYKWSEYELNNASWLISNGSFHSGATYTAVYELLLKIYNGTETKAGVSVKLTEQPLYCFSESGTTNPYLLSSETVKVGQTIYGYNSLQVKGVVTAVNTDSIVIKDETANTTLTLTRYQSGDKVGSIYTDYDYVINTADTTFRLPIKVKLASGNAVVGNGMTLGLTNGSQNFGLFTSANDSIQIAGQAGYGQDVGYITRGSGTKGNVFSGITTDPTKSGIETSSSGLKLYFYVGETIQDANVINAAGVLTRVAELSNEYIVGLGMPDYSAGVSQSAQVLYTAPVDGVILGFNYTNGENKLTINGFTFNYNSGNASNIYSGSGFCIPVSKGDTYKMEQAFSGSIAFLTFYPLKGVN